MQALQALQQQAAKPRVVDDPVAMQALQALQQQQQQQQQHQAAKPSAAAPSGQMPISIATQADAKQAAQQPTLTAPQAPAAAPFAGQPHAAGSPQAAGSPVPLANGKEMDPTVKTIPDPPAQWYTPQVTPASSTTSAGPPAMPGMTARPSSMLSVRVPKPPDLRVSTCVPDGVTVEYMWVGWGWKGN